MRWVGLLECGHTVGGDRRVPETEIEYLCCATCTVEGKSAPRWYRLVQVITDEPERAVDGKAW